MQTGRGGRFISQKMNKQDMYQGFFYSIVETQKIWNDSPGFPHVCIQQRVQRSSSVGEMGIQVLSARGERRNPSWELAGNDRSGTLVPLCTRAWKPQSLGEASVHLRCAGNSSSQATLSAGCAGGRWTVAPDMEKKLSSREETKPGLEPLRFHSVDLNIQLEDQEGDFGK